MSSTALEMEEIIRRARKFKTVIIFPHPFCGVYTGIQNSYFSEDRLERIFPNVDGVEVINSENMNKSNLRSALLGFNLGKGITGGSDGHRISQMGKAVTYAVCKPSRKAFLDAIKKNKTKVVGKEIDLIHKMTSNGKLSGSGRKKPQVQLYGDKLQIKRNKRKCEAQFEWQKKSAAKKIQGCISR
jgi:predicted metal-dependent phosphoesterase TrpH